MDFVVVIVDLVDIDQIVQRLFGAGAYVDFVIEFAVGAREAVAALLQADEDESDVHHQIQTANEQQAVEDLRVLVLRLLS